MPTLFIARTGELTPPGMYLLRLGEEAGGDLGVHEMPLQRDDVRAVEVRGKLHHTRERTACARVHKRWTMHGRHAAQTARSAGGVDDGRQRPTMTRMRPRT